MNLTLFNLKNVVKRRFSDFVRIKKNVRKVLDFDKEKKVKL